MKNTSRKGSQNPKAKSGKLSVGKNFESRVVVETSPKYLETLSEMIVNPAECSTIVKAPADFPMVGDVKCFTRAFQLKASDLTDGKFAMTVSPSIENFFSVSSATPLSVPAGGRAAGELHPVDFNGSEFFAGTLDLWNALYPNQAANFGCDAIEWFGKWGYRVTAPAGSVFDLALYTNGQKPDVYTIWFYDGIGAAWLNMGTYFAGIPGARVPYTVPGGTALECIAIECRPKSATVQLDCYIPPGAAYPQGAHLYSLYSSNAVLIGRIERWRVIALSIKVSYSGNMLNNGGVIAGARTQPQYSFDDLPYEALTKLQDHKYQGPMVEGAYVWWLPYSYAEMDYKTNILDHSAATQLRVAGEFADASGAVQVTVTSVVEFMSPLQIFNHDHGPCATDEYLQLLHALDRLPAATCNPSHTEILSALWDKGVSVAKGGVRFLMEHPELVAKLAAMFLA